MNDIRMIVTIDDAELMLIKSANSTASRVQMSSKWHGKEVIITPVSDEFLPIIDNIKEYPARLVINSSYIYHKKVNTDKVSLPVQFTGAYALIFEAP